MCHFGNGESVGNYLDTQNWAKFEQRILETMLDIYVEKCQFGKFFKEHYKKPTAEKVKNYLRRKLKGGDWFLSSHEAAYYGFSDGVISSKKYGSINSLK